MSKACDGCVNGVCTTVSVKNSTDGVEKMEGKCVCNKGFIGKKASIANKLEKVWKPGPKKIVRYQHNIKIVICKWPNIGVF